MEDADQLFSVFREGQTRENWFQLKPLRHELNRGRNFLTFGVISLRNGLGFHT